jgi:Papain family cysteine protease
MWLLKSIILLGAAGLGLSTAGLRAAPESDGASTNAPAIRATIDLRPAFEQGGLSRRQQGARPTCSVFTVVGAMEFAIATKQGHTPRLSVEFLNWAANRACGDSDDGGFFSDLWKGFSAYGICVEADMPYAAKFDPSVQPSAAALQNAQARRALGLRLHWIKEWNVNTGLSEEQLAAIKRTLGQGWPVCSGLRWPKQEQWSEHVLQMCSPDAVRDGHSVLLVGWRDDLAQPGGGVLVFRNTGGNGQDGAMPYAYARQYMNDAVWFDYDAASR